MAEPQSNLLTRQSIMKNQKNLRQQLRLKTGQLAPAAWLIQLHALEIKNTFVQARKIPVVFHHRLEESLAIKHIASVHLSDRR
jgi:hypothetical protein